MSPNNVVGDLEECWKIIRRGYFEKESSRTVSMAEAMQRITHVLLVYASTTGRLIEREKWGDLGPKIAVRPMLPKDVSDLTIDKILWEVEVRFDGLGMKGLPLRETKPSPEEALEVIFNTFYVLLQEEIDRRAENVKRMRREADTLESEAAEIASVRREMGVYDSKQLNLPEGKPDRPF